MLYENLAMNATKAKMTEAVEKAGVPNMVWFAGRVPAITLARQIIDDGRIAKSFIRATYLQVGPSARMFPWEERPCGASTKM